MRRNTSTIADLPPRCLVPGKCRGGLHEESIGRQQRAKYLLVVAQHVLNRLIKIRDKPSAIVMMLRGLVLEYFLAFFVIEVFAEEPEQVGADSSISFKHLCCLLVQNISDAGRDSSAQAFISSGPVAPRGGLGICPRCPGAFHRIAALPSRGTTVQRRRDCR